MAAGATYEPIATQTTTSSVATVTFSSIPSTYTDLVLVYSAALSTNYDLYFRLNGDSGNNYSYTVLYSNNGASYGSARTNGQDKGSLDYYGAPTTTLGNNTTIANFLNYSNSTTYKTSLVRSNSTTGLDAIVGIWTSTAAITSIALGTFTTPTLSSGSTFTLYGIKAA